jgi:hypothetical protein
VSLSQPHLWGGDNYTTVVDANHEKCAKDDAMEEKSEIRGDDYQACSGEYKAIV